MKKIIIFGGTSLISIELIKKFNLETEKFLVVCRSKNKFENLIENFDDLLRKKIEIFEINLLNLNDNFSFIAKLEDHFYDGVFFLIGETGNPDVEFDNHIKCKENYDTNLIHPVLVINSLTKKLKENSFICVFTSMAGLRGRAVRLYYCSAKAGLISYLSGLRQKLYKNNISVINVIAGYMKTEKFTYKANKFLINNPENIALKIHKGIKKRKENIYTSYIWFMISILIRLIPEKIFTKLKF